MARIVGVLSVTLFILSTTAAFAGVLPALFLLGMLTFHFLIRPTLGAEPLNQMLFLVGLSLVLQNGALALFSAARDRIV